LAALKTNFAAYYFIEIMYIQCPTLAPDKTIDVKTSELR